jgi:hypothetical protein
MLPDEFKRLTLIPAHELWTGWQRFRPIRASISGSCGEGEACWSSPHTSLPLKQARCSQSRLANISTRVLVTI